MKTIGLNVCVLAIFLLGLAQIDRAQPPNELRISQKIRLDEGQFHELEIKKSGVYLDGTKKLATAFDDIWPISDTIDYWNYPDAFYKVSSTGHFFLFGTHIVQGICGMSNYAIVWVTPSGAMRVSTESPGVCMGDNPSEIRFSVRYIKGGAHPTWNLSGRLEFDAFTFAWKDLTKRRSRKK